MRLFERRSRKIEESEKGFFSFRGILSNELAGIAEDRYGVVESRTYDVECVTLKPNSSDCCNIDLTFSCDSRHRPFTFTFGIDECEFDGSALDPTMLPQVVRAVTHGDVEKHSWPGLSIVKISGESWSYILYPQAAGIRTFLHRRGFKYHIGNAEVFQYRSWS